MTDERIKELANKWCLHPTDNAWDEVLGFAYDLLAESREWVGLTDEEIFLCNEYPVDECCEASIRRAEAKLKEKNS